MFDDGFTNSNPSAAIDRDAAASAQVENLHIYLPIGSGRCIGELERWAARKGRPWMRRIRASAHGLIEGSDLTGTEKCQRSETVGRRVPMIDDGVPQVRNRNRHRGYRRTPDGVEMLRISRLIGCSIRRHRRCATVRLIHWSALGTIRTTARRCGTRLRCGNTQTERK